MGAQKFKVILGYVSRFQPNLGYMKPYLRNGKSALRIRKLWSSKKAKLMKSELWIENLWKVVCCLDQERVAVTKWDPIGQSLKDWQCHAERMCRSVRE